MVIANCTIDGCEFRTADTSEALAIALLANHGIAHQIQPQASTGSSPTLRGPKLERPKVDVGVSIEEWNIFVRRWSVFRAGSGIDDASAPSQLFQWAGTALGDSLLKSNANARSLPFADLLKAICSLAIIPVAVGVLRTELLQLWQDSDEAFRTYSARVRGKAETFAATCTCGLAVDSTSFPGSLLFTPQEAREGRPWLGMVTCLPKSGRLQISDWREGRLSVSLSILSVQGMGKHAPVRINLQNRACFKGYVKWSRV